MLDQNNTSEIPSGVSESASYMKTIIILMKPYPKKVALIVKVWLKSILQNFFRGARAIDSEPSNFKEDNDTQQLFDQEPLEEEDFEIPAFLRRQKF